MESYKRLLLDNKIWVQEKLLMDENYFIHMSKEQNPEFLWIGCSDSRVPANEITNTDPGDIFVQRNIANLVVNTDLNLLSVLQYAVDELKVKHIIVCGHYGCGGVKAALSNKTFGMLNKWLHNIKDIYRIHEKELEAIESMDKRCDRMVEINVCEQVFNLLKTSIVQKAWKKHQRPTLHGWVYSMHDGILSELVCMKPGEEIPEIFKYNFEE
jgi:carbonic anhydrase